MKSRKWLAGAQECAQICSSAISNVDAIFHTTPRMKIVQQVRRIVPS